MLCSYRIVDVVERIRRDEFIQGEATRFVMFDQLWDEPIEIAISLNDAVDSMAIGDESREIDLQAAVDLRRHAHQAEQAVAAEGIQRYFYDRFTATGLEGKFDTVILNGANRLANGLDRGIDDMGCPQCFRHLPPCGNRLYENDDSALLNHSAHDRGQAHRTTAKNRYGRPGPASE